MLRYHVTCPKFVTESKKVITYGVRKGTVSQRVRVSPGKTSLQSVAIGTDDGGNDIVRSTSVERVAQGDPATMRAATRENAEQASKPGMREPTRPYVGKAPTDREASGKRAGWFGRMRTISEQRMSLVRNWERF